MNSDNKYRPRLIDNKIKQYLNVFGAVCVEGIKGCGKTSAVSLYSNSMFMINDPKNNYSNRTLAKISIDIVLDGDRPRLIDEWQEVPEIWDAVRYKVDETGNKGQYILTGSSTPSHKGILHSGAGRIGKIRMNTMSLFESGDSSGLVSLKDICDDKISYIDTGVVNLKDLAKYIVRGGFLSNLNVDDKDIDLLPKNYLKDIIDDDVNRLDEIKYDLNKIRLVLKELARNESTTISNAKLLRDIKDKEGSTIDINTLRRYLDVFERLFLLNNQKPFSTNIRSKTRIKEAEKRHFADPSLACALLDLNVDKLMSDMETFGFLFEALCERDLMIYADMFDAKVFHYQDYNNKEIDAVIELNDGNYVAVEIKLGAHQIDAAAESLINLRDSITNSGGKAPSVLVVLCGMTNMAYRRPDGVIVVPLTALKD